MRKSGGDEEQDRETHINLWVCQLAIGAVGAQMFFSGTTMNSELYDISVTSYAHHKGKGS